SHTLLLAFWARHVLRSRSDRDRDGPCALSLVTMLLLSPIIWNHYIILLSFLLIRLLVAASTTRSDSVRLATFLVTTTLLLGSHLTNFLLPHLTGCDPLVVILVLSCPCYALIGLFALQLTERTSYLSTWHEHRSAKCASEA